ncbi:penicillin-binding transpeptidase domain-containing protein [Amycolatopsis sp. YIM 10]|uniref:penicillin-binding transpeptidase domain-containing protein n=1 Tax=Amycolatopsis sp. YIM 10 TaxID=2653857 RepID=UPI001290544E|nr:penicillin-binding transpeptidase domain-containing protein [Amycolatopsis sp. YIM 10]QFU87987.1 Penicillin-binding protein A [Amycolatopsis sp. YIM 10]
MTAVAKRWVLGVAAVAVVGIVAAAVVFLSRDDEPASVTAEPPPGPRETVTRYLTALSSGDHRAAAGLTDDPAAAIAVLDAVRTGLNAEKLTAKLVELAETTAEISFDWKLGVGDWRYDSTIEFAQRDGTWLVHWTPAQIHPKLTADKRLAVKSAEGAPVLLDRDGKAMFVREGGGTKPVAGLRVDALIARIAGYAAEHAPVAWSVELRDAAGTTLEDLGGAAGLVAEPLVSTLSSEAQEAAQKAVDSAGGAAMLVAINSATGRILAMAQNAAAGDQPKAVSGLYPPGSTFKIATAAAAMRAGTGPDTVLDCPGEARIGTRTIPNDDRFTIPPSPLHTTFARSCNTTFARLAGDLPADALAGAATGFGLNADFDIPGLATETGKVEAYADEAKRVEAGIGQGDVVASPFGVALMTATVASGQPITPSLWRDDASVVTTGYEAPEAEVLGPLRDMMREVVTGGTARELARYGDVRGKTGTAQFGDGRGAHGWFTGYRGEVAFAVLVENAGSSGPALAVSGRFLSAV